MKRPRFETIEKKRPEAILFIDKKGYFIQGLLPLLPKTTPLVIASSEKPVIQEAQPVGFVPFKHTMPKIPDTYYSHIFVVYDGETDVLTIIPEVLKKAQTDESKIFFIMDLFFASPEFVSELTHSYRNSTVLIIGDTFGKGAPVASSTIHRFFDEAAISQQLLVCGSGTATTFPVYFPDMLEVIMHASFGVSKTKIGYIFPKHSPTQISLARLFQSINPFLRIDFVDEKEYAAESVGNSQKAMHVTDKGVYLLQNNYPLIKKIKDANMLSLEEKKTPSPTGATYSKKIPLKSGYVSPKKPFPFWLVWLFLFALFLPFLTTVLFAGVGVAGLLFAKDALLHTSFQKATQSATISYTFFSLAKTTDGIVNMQLSLVGLNAPAQKASTLINLGQDGSFALLNISQSVQSYLAIFHNESITPQSDFLVASNQLKKAITIYEKVKAEDVFPGFRELDDLVGIVGNTIDSYPSLLGFDREKTYLLLFQNNMELRPAGGFIGSYGLLKVHHGNIKDFTIHDVYDADGQLTGHVEPFYPFRRYMQTVHLYMRDSNYSPDFPTAASMSANMLHLETKDSVDGVVAVDVSFVKALVGAFGSVQVPDYNETVTPDNFYMLTQSHVEKNFFPGSTQKKDFLRSLLTALQAKVTDAHTLPYLSLGKTLSQSLLQKHILFAFPDESIQHLFAINGLSSSLLDSRDSIDNQYNDTLGISEANIGANKANAFVYRKVEQHVVLLDSGAIQNTVTLRYKNTSNEWPGGDYKNYLRIITPLGSRLSDITIDGKHQVINSAITDYLLYERPDFTPPPGLEVETATEEKKTLFGFLTIIPKGTFKTITITYLSPTVLDLGKQKVSYDLWYIKQPGTDVYPYTFSFSYPPSFKALKASSGFQSADMSLSLSKDVTTDEDFHIELSKL